MDKNSYKHICVHTKKNQIIHVCIRLFNIKLYNNAFKSNNSKDIIVFSK